MFSQLDYVFYSGSSAFSQAFVQSAKAARWVMWGLLLLIVSFGLIFGLTGCQKKDPSKVTLGKRIEGDKLDQDKVAIYFVREEKNEAYVEGLVRQIPKEAYMDRLHFAILLLMNGPVGEEKKMGYYTEIPEKARLISVAHTGRYIRLNFNKAFVSGGGSHSMTVRLEQLERTIRDQNIKTPIYVDVEGRELETLGGEGVEVMQPLNKETP